MPRKKKPQRQGARASAVDRLHVPHSSKNQRSHSPASSSIKGTDDAGVFYSSYDQLLAAQNENKEEWYRANAAFWAAGGYCGATDDEAMIGDDGGIEDGNEGLAFLDRLCAMQANPDSRATKHPQFLQAIDLGAGVGRVTKLVLLKRYNTVRLVEADEALSKRSRVYLGRKRSSRCTFSHQNLHSLTDDTVLSWGAHDMMWIQWCFQYMIDADVIHSLRTLATGLRPLTGMLVVKENRPYGTAREDRFSMDVPEGENERYDITRSDGHHRLLFRKAGLKVALVEKGVETHTYALVR